MSGKSNNASYSPNRTDTMIGAGVRIEGKIAFTGVLRVQGNILGDVRSDVGSHETIVVDSSGVVTGALQAPHIVARGRVLGPVHASQSIQIQQGASVIGDVCYREIEIQAGGIIEGLLIPAPSDRDSLSQDQRLPAYKAPAVEAAAGHRRTIGRGLGGAVALLIAALAAIWAYRNQTAIAPPLADVALKADSSFNGPAAPSAPLGGVLQDVPKAATGNAASTTPNSSADAKGVVPTAPPERRDVEPEKVVTVEGVNPAKPAGFFWLISKKPSVLFKKKRQDPGDGKRIDVAQGAKVSIAISENDLFRVAEGQEVEILYQGRKVGPKTIESGAWMSFVPQSSRGK